MFLLVHVCICVGSRHLDVWGELASHKRSSTHHPSSQGWASRCLELCMFVYFLFVWVHGLLLSSAFLLPLLAGVLYICNFMYHIVNTCKIEYWVECWLQCLRTDNAAPLPMALCNSNSVHVLHTASYLILACLSLHP